MPAQKIEDALRTLQSAFPLTKFKIENGQITYAGGVVDPGLIAGTPLAMVRTVGAALKAIDAQQAEAARKKAEEAATSPDA
jgi:hypothetical protein